MFPYRLTDHSESPPGYEDSAIESHRDEDILSMDASSRPPTDRSSVGVGESTTSRMDSLDSGLPQSSLYHAPEMPTVHEDAILGQCSAVSKSVSRQGPEVEGPHPYYVMAQINWL